VSVLHFPGIDRMAKRTMALPAEPRLTIEDVPEDALSGLDTALSPKNRASGATVVCLLFPPGRLVRSSRIFGEMTPSRTSVLGTHCGARAFILGIISPAEIT
jgi:hypothetical protein